MLSVYKEKNDCFVTTKHFTIRQIHVPTAEEKYVRLAKQQNMTQQFTIDSSVALFACSLLCIIGVPH